MNNHEAQPPKPHDPCPLLRELQTASKFVPSLLGQDISASAGPSAPIQSGPQIAASRYVGCMAAVATSPMVAVTMTHESKSWSHHGPALRGATWGVPKEGLRRHHWCHRADSQNWAHNSISR